jgi:hypothetical protein
MNPSAVAKLCCVPTALAAEFEAAYKAAEYNTRCLFKSYTVNKAPYLLSREMASWFLCHQGPTKLGFVLFLLLYSLAHCLRPSLPVLMVHHQSRKLKLHTKHWKVLFVVV